MEREEEHLFPNRETYTSVERMRHGMKLNRREVTPVEEVLIETLNPEQLALEGLNLVLKNPVEEGWELR